MPYPIRLSRTVRFIVNPMGQDGSAPPSGHNGYAGKPAMQGLGRYYELDVKCVGRPQQDTGYLINIKDIDDAAWRSAIPIVQHACNEHPTTDPATLMPDMLQALRAALEPPLHSLTFRLTPTYRCTMHAESTNTVVVRQRFDFAAAHRLHVPHLSDEQNKQTFGHCNHPSGHGHNYQVEPAIAMDPTAPALDLHTIEQLTDQAVIDVFDHTNLDLDHPEFDAVNGGTTSSVENIARVCYHKLHDAIDKASHGNATLRAITVWETERTSATFPADPLA